MMPFVLPTRHGYILDQEDIELYDLAEQVDSPLSPLHLAALRNHTTIVRMLIGKGADVNITGTLTVTGQTPLHACAVNGCRQSCEVLLNSGAEASPQDDEGNTPLHIAAVKDSRTLWSCWLEMVQSSM